MNGARCSSPPVTVSVACRRAVGPELRRREPADVAVALQEVVDRVHRALLVPDARPGVECLLVRRLVVLHDAAVVLVASHQHQRLGREADQVLLLLQLVRLDPQRPHRLAVADEDGQSLDRLVIVDDRKVPAGDLLAGATAVRRPRTGPPASAPWRSQWSPRACHPVPASPSPRPAPRRPFPSPSPRADKLGVVAASSSLLRW